ncbi:hypothetical protein OHAE_48 [Ochrobactrum soli]|uniref:Uncharacterized protein n=1 Tax=Ochrobactrum soli TaxID=2448455 RepID=A0A2P9HJ63_9HYPH|nr:hypothetical protein OHAE_48 [[Ochrobactrum] soli]
MIRDRFERKFSEHFYHASIGAIPGKPLTAFGPEPRETKD